ncbi:hypothetical protein MGG_16587 [Pyricularia oryzae 70-15]|uniref:Uncharacterized protein n=3 Tax=Pyricularia oryzae TaxID=318829 RepID=G4MZT5_PYRO7|nr:uncharacterized protein MGG_16587 [Pyricularia oryzae 70-15]EHA51379.1 hypothetical protein MGG_16587 [Pyricularia oryzae 70-15]ELQ34994.1 hypothetical protein OOU_Y34scaffold00734g5 [Pyricularia oryzae Y34]
MYRVSITAGTRKPPRAKTCPTPGFSTTANTGDKPRVVCDPLTPGFANGYIGSGSGYRRIAMLFYPMDEKTRKLQLLPKPPGIR